jgi:hypothetical protein
MSPDEYVRNAIECMNLAAQIKNPKDRLQLLLMARAWLKLADYSFMFDDVAKIVSVVTPEAPKQE